MGGAEAGRRAVRGAAEIQRAVDGPLLGARAVVGAAEDPALPAPPVTARVRGETAVAGARDELGDVHTILGKSFQERTVVDR